MASLSQYPASNAEPEDVVETANVNVELSVAGLFTFEEERSLSRDGDTVALVPMTLPTIGRDTSLGVTAALSKEIKCGSTRHSSQGIVRQAFLVASRDGHAPLLQENNHLPMGFIHDAVMMVQDAAADPTLMTQTAHMFSKEAKSLANLKSRPSVAQDLDDLVELLLKLNSELTIPLESGMSAAGSPVKRMAEAMYMLQNLISNGVSFEKIFESAASLNSRATSQHNSSLMGRRIQQELAEVVDVIGREELHYLALNSLLTKLCPVFLSPVTSAAEVLAGKMTRAGLEAKTEGTRVPYLLLSATTDGAQEMKPEEKITVTLYGPRDKSQEGLVATVKFLFQRSVRISRSIGTSTTTMDPTNR